MLEHGGKLLAASQRCGIPLDRWIDLSTGIHPIGWPVPPIPPECWQRLPEDDDGLLSAAADYYGTPHLLSCAGSQAAIQLLPQLRPHSRVGILSPTYAEHAHAWQRAGHQVEALTELRDDMGVLVLANPNNPTGQLIPPDTLREVHARLAARGGWLVVDEAFMDATPEHSLAADAGAHGLVILRSVGKFFGLAGIRAGFLLAWPELLAEVQERLGPWSVPAPSRWVAQQALRDTLWQAEQRNWLTEQSRQLAALLDRHGLAPSGGTALFQWVCTPEAAAIHERLARLGILTRLFNESASLRFGLPGTERAWMKLDYLLSV
jgi:cobalamin biosynthetic protein CobC